MAADDEGRREANEGKNNEDKGNNERRSDSENRSSNGSRSFIPLILGGSCLFALACTLLFTEFIFDASVWLEKKILLGLVAVILVMSAFYFIPNKIISMVLSIVSTVIFIALLIWLIYRRNRVTKYYISAREFTNRDIQRIREKMRKSQVILMASSDKIDVPPELSNYTRVNCREKLKLNERISSKNKGRCSNRLTIDQDALRNARYSGIKRNLLIMLYGSDLTDETYFNYGLIAF